MEFVIVRHVETVGNVEHRFNGRTESPLTAHGIKMKEKVVAKLLAIHQKRPFDRVMSSPTGRARVMGEDFSKKSGMPLEIDESLMEFDFGDFDGLTAREAAEQKPELWAEWVKDYTQIKLSPKGSFKDFHAGLKKWLDHLDLSANERVLIFTHGGTFNSLLLHLLDLPMESRWHFAVGTGGIAEIDAPDGYGILKALYTLEDEEN